MPVSATGLDALLAAGATAEAIVAFVKAELVADEQRVAQKRTKEANRKRQWRASEMSRGHRGTSRDTPTEAQSVVAASFTVSQDTVSVSENKNSDEKRGVSLTYLPSSTTGSVGKKERGSDTRARAREAPHPDFDRFWQKWPHKVAKADAVKAFSKAIKKATMDELLNGIEIYITTKPPDRSWLNPATWLNGERWKDQPAILNGGNGNGKSHKGGLAGALARLSERADELAESAVSQNGEAAVGLLPFG